MTNNEIFFSHAKNKSKGLYFSKIRVDKHISDIRMLIFIQITTKFILRNREY